MQGVFEDLTGRKYERLTVVQKTAEKGRGSYWICQCSCGKTVTRYGVGLTNGKTRSCGCLKADLIKTHGQCRVIKRSVEYASWLQMKARCCRRTHNDYHNYGGRGIAICERWLHSFENFFADMGAKPTNKHSLDRIDTEGNYEPSNCKWSTQYEQNRNMRRNVVIMFNGETMILNDWATRIGISNTALSARLKKWSKEKALTTPPQLSGRRTKITAALAEYKGE